MKILLAIVISYVLTINIGYSNNLVQNGDFSNFNLGINNNHYIAPSGTAIVANWQSATGYPWISETGGWDGNPGWVLPNPGNSGSIFQSGINIINGRTYEISMYIKLQDPRPWPSPNEGSVSVKFLGDLTQTSVTIDSGISSTQWTKYTQIWTATDNFNAINLSATAWMNIDNVSISEYSQQGSSGPLKRMAGPFNKHEGFNPFAGCEAPGGVCFTTTFPHPTGPIPFPDYGIYNMSVQRDIDYNPRSIRMIFDSDPFPINGQIPIVNDIMLSSEVANTLGFKEVFLRKGNYPVDYSTNQYGIINVDANFVSINQVPYGGVFQWHEGHYCVQEGGVCFYKLVRPRHWNFNIIRTTPDFGMGSTEINYSNPLNPRLVFKFWNDPQPISGHIPVDETMDLNVHIANELGYRRVVLAQGNYPVVYSGSTSSSAGITDYGEISVDIELIDPINPIDITLIPEGLLSNGNLTLNDTCIAYLRSSVSPYNILDTSVAVVDSITFTGKFNFKETFQGEYYISVKNRNSIETWSSNTILMSENNVSYDFTTSSAMAFGANMILRGGKYCIYSGDVSQDGIIDLSDLNFIYNDGINFASGYLNTDLTGDGIIDLTDLNIAYNNGINFVAIIRP